MMLSPHFQPTVIAGAKFDNGCILYEFTAHREPEATQFARIGEWVKARCEMREIATPRMWWRGRYWPDLYIADQLDAVPESWHVSSYSPSEVMRRNKADWPDRLSLEQQSVLFHGEPFHNAFIEPMCRKISARPSREMCAKFHRALWLPLYWPETLRARESLRTPFWYPKAGYAGAIAEANRPNEQGAERYADGPRASRASTRSTGMDEVVLTFTFVLAKPLEPFSALFVVDPSPIYRITDQDECAQTGAEVHRWVVESRGAINAADLIPWAKSAHIVGTKTIRLPLPTLINVSQGWKPRPHMNAQLWEHINASAGT